MLSLLINSASISLRFYRPQSTAQIFPLSSIGSERFVVEPKHEVNPRNAQPEKIEVAGYECAYTRDRCGSQSRSVCPLHTRWRALGSNNRQFEGQKGRTSILPGEKYLSILVPQRPMHPGGAVRQGSAPGGECDVRDSDSDSSPCGGVWLPWLRWGPKRGLRGRRPWRRRC